MANIDITRTELVWPGKYNDDGTRKEVPRVHLPFQVIETINQSRATREAEKQRQSSLFDIWEGKEGDTFEAGWQNKLIWGDNLLVMGSLLEKFAGKIDLIYIDPPFATGRIFRSLQQIGERGDELTKEAVNSLKRTPIGIHGAQGSIFISCRCCPIDFSLMHDLLSHRRSDLCPYRLATYRHLCRASYSTKSSVRTTSSIEIVWNVLHSIVIIGKAHASLSARITTHLLLLKDETSSSGIMQYSAHR